MDYDHRKLIGHPPDDPEVSLSRRVETGQTGSFPHPDEDDAHDTLAATLRAYDPTAPRPSPATIRPERYEVRINGQYRDLEAGYRVVDTVECRTVSVHRYFQDALAIAARLTQEAQAADSEAAYHAAAEAIFGGGGDV